MDDLLIYGLKDSVSGEIRYIGLSKSGINRPKQHFKKSSYSGHYPVSKWVKKHIEAGHCPLIVILDRAEDYSQLRELEKFYIKLFREGGARLLNMTDGGEGTIGLKHTSEFREKCRERMLGNKPSIETIQKTKQTINKLLNEQKLPRQISIIDQYGTEYPSIHEAARQISGYPQNIEHQLNGRRAHVKGYIFKVKT